MTHAVTDIRDALASTLTTALSGAAGVTVSQYYRLQAPSLPTLDVKIGPSEIEEATGDRLQLWETDFLIRIVNRDTSDIDASTFTLAETALNALAADPTLGSLAQDSAPVAISEAETEPDAEQPIETRTLTYRVLFAVNATAQGVTV